MSLHNRGKRNRFNPSGSPNFVSQREKFLDKFDLKPRDQGFINQIKSNSLSDGLSSQNTGAGIGSTKGIAKGGIGKKLGVIMQLISMFSSPNIPQIGSSNAQSGQVVPKRRRQ